MRCPHFAFRLPLHLLLPLALCLGLVLLLSACSSTNRLLKARPVTLTSFFEHPQLAQDARKQLGFQKVWTTPDRAVLAASLTKRRLYIAPVTLAYLRPVDKALATQEIAWGLQRQERDIAIRLHQEFTAAFQRSPRPLYQLACQPGPDTVILQLALTELNPTSPKGNAVMTMMKIAVSPVAALGGFFTKGNIAIEGKMLVPMPMPAASSSSVPAIPTKGRGKPAVKPTSKPSSPLQHRPYFQFADNEADKLTLVSARDYQPYGHAVHTIREWAVHFEEMTRAPRGTKVGDSSAVTLRVY
ncbi:MAG: DUF3313 family protein [Prosthecobacter sp.]